MKLCGYLGSDVKVASFSSQAAPVLPRCRHVRVHRYMHHRIIVCLCCIKAAVHWEWTGCALAQSSPNLTWTAIGLRADSARPQRVSDSARTDSRCAESARNPIVANVKFGDDCTNAQPGLSQWTAAFRVLIAVSFDYSCSSFSSQSYHFIPVLFDLMTGSM